MRVFYQVRAAAALSHVVPSSSHELPTYTLCRVVGVFDTVGALGLPHAITLSNKAKTLFDFPDKILGEHIERAYHSMALDEQREDFVGLILYLHFFRHLMILIMVVRTGRYKIPSDREWKAERPNSSSSVFLSFLRYVSIL